MSKAQLMDWPLQWRRVASGQKSPAGLSTVQARARDRAHARSLLAGAWQREATGRVRSRRLRETCREAVRSCLTERICVAVLTLAGMGSVLWAFGEIWIRLQNWPAFEAWVQRLAGA